MCQWLFCHKNNSCALYTHMLYYLGSEKSLDERKKFLYSWYIIMVTGCSIQAYVDNLFVFLLSHIAYLKVFFKCFGLVLRPTSMKQWRKTSIGVRYNLIY